MPNHVTNKLFIDGQADQVAAVMNAIKGQYVDRDGTTIITRIDFNTIIPMPESLNIQVHSGIEDAAKRATQGEPPPKSFNPEEAAMLAQYLENVRIYGVGYWYPWRCRHWGTKWNAYETPNKRDTEDTIVFETAWSMAAPVFTALSRKYPDLVFWLEYADEDTGRNLGSVCFEGGVMRRVRDIPEGTQEARRFAMELCNPGLSAEELAEYGMDANYNYIDEDEAAHE